VGRPELQRWRPNSPQDAQEPCEQVLGGHLVRNDRGAVPRGKRGLRPCPSAEALLGHHLCVDQEWHQQREGPVLKRRP
jgi:hypothetical protein